MFSSMELVGNTLIFLPSLITSTLGIVKRISAGVVTFPAKLTTVLLKKTWEISLNRDVPINFHAKSSTLHSLYLKRGFKKIYLGS